MVKCFWCGTLNHSDAEVCTSCRRTLIWSPFLQAILRPAIGDLMGARAETLAAAVAHNRTP